MDLKDQIVKVLLQELKPEYVRLEDDDGISGFVVSRSFENLSSLDRQGKIDQALDRASLTPEERRQVLMIAGLTPPEYEAVGARIQVHKIKDTASDTLEILLQGGPSDAEYVRGALNHQKGVRTTAPKPVSSALGVLMSFRANGTEANPLTKEKALRVLKNDRYIQVLPNA